jgi:hypothetical protein
VLEDDRNVNRAVSAVVFRRGVRTDGRVPGA